MDLWDKILIPLITILVSISGSLIVAFFSLRHNQQQLLTQTVTVNRMDWIKETRKLLSEFISIYCLESEVPERREKLLALKASVALYMRNDKPSYKKLLLQMDQCINRPFNRADYDQLILHGQYLLERTWVRIKIESKEHLEEDAIYKKVNEQTEDLKKLTEKRK